MGMTTERLLLVLAKSAINGTPFSYRPTMEEFRRVYALAAQQDLAHIVYATLARADALPPTDTDDDVAFMKTAEQAVMAAQYRYAKHEAELAHIGVVLEKAGVAYMPLKGSVLRNDYPEPWMRTSCDIDVLVHEEDLDIAIAVLTAEGYTTDGVRNYHDVSLYCDGVHLELHHNVLERVPSMDALLSKIWENSTADGLRHREMPAFFAFHHLAHMAHHLLGGGCGVRAVMDWWVIRHTPGFNKQKVRALCRAASLERFYEAVTSLAGYWFGDSDSAEGELEDYILHGGLFGNDVQRYATAAARHGRLYNAWRTVLMPYRDLQHVYPKLRGKPLLTPFYQLHRIVTRLSQKRGRAALDRIYAVGTQSDVAIERSRHLLRSLGLY